MLRKKSADARFFGTFHNFFLFKKNVQNPKKSEKCPKNRVFPYALRHSYQYFHVTYYAYNVTFYISK